MKKLLLFCFTLFMVILSVNKVNAVSIKCNYHNPTCICSGKEGGCGEYEETCHFGTISLYYGDGGEEDRILYLDGVEVKKKSMPKDKPEKCPSTLYVVTASQNTQNRTIVYFSDGDAIRARYHLSSSNKYASCGSTKKIPLKIPYITSLIITLVEVSVPVLLVVLGMIDLFKGIMAQKDEEIKKGQTIFIKRLITGAIIFFVIVVVKFIISIAADSSSNDIIECIDCFTSNEC